MKDFILEKEKTMPDIKRIFEKSNEQDNMLYKKNKENGIFFLIKLK